MVPPLFVTATLAICAAFVSALNFSECQFGWATADAALAGAAFGIFVTMTAVIMLQSVIDSAGRAALEADDAR